MNPEQLQQTRAQRWHQNGEALLTLEAAREWLQETGLCLFLPRKMQLPAPAPSFVEAFLGETNATPSLEQIENATAMLARLTDEGDVLALNLLGVAGEQPDFLVTPEYLSYIFTLRGDKGWKHDPATTGTGRVSPLVLEVWKAIERTGVQTAIELRETAWQGAYRGRHPSRPARSVDKPPRHPAPRLERRARHLGSPEYPLRKRHDCRQSHLAGHRSIGPPGPLSADRRRGHQRRSRGVSLTARLAHEGSRSHPRPHRHAPAFHLFLDAQPLLYVEGTLPEFGEPIDMADIEPIVAPAPPPPVPPVQLEGEGFSIEPISGSTPPPASGSKIRKYTPRPAAAGPDPLRWKRDSSVPVPPGKRRSSAVGPDRDEPRFPRPESEKFATRRSSPRPPAGADVTGRPRRTPSDRPSREGTGDRPARPYSPRPTGDRPAASGAPRQRTGYPKAAPNKIGPRREGAIPGEGAGSAKKGRWVPRTGAGDRRDEKSRRDAAPRREGGFAGPSGRTSPRSGGGDFKSRSFKDRGQRPEGGSRPSFDRPRSDRPLSAAPGRIVRRVPTPSPAAASSLPGAKAQQVPIAPPAPPLPSRGKKTRRASAPAPKAEVSPPVSVAPRVAASPQFPPASIRPRRSRRSPSPPSRNI